MTRDPTQSHHAHTQPPTTEHAQVHVLVNANACTQAHAHAHTQALTHTHNTPPHTTHRTHHTCMHTHVNTHAHSQSKVAYAGGQTGRDTRTPHLQPPQSKLVSGVQHQLPALGAEPGRCHCPQPLLLCTLLSASSALNLPVDVVPPRGTTHHHLDTHWGHHRSNRRQQRSTPLRPVPVPALCRPTTSNICGCRSSHLSNGVYGGSHCREAPRVTVQRGVPGMQVSHIQSHEGAEGCQGGGGGGGGGEVGGRKAPRTPLPRAVHMHTHTHKCGDQGDQTRLNKAHNTNLTNLHFFSIQNYPGNRNSGNGNGIWRFLLRFLTRVSVAPVNQLTY